MITYLPDELLMNIRECSKNQDWKYLMDTSYDSFRDLKYRTIKVYVVFRKLNDRVLPPIVSKLIDPLKQLYLYLETEDSAEWKDDEFEVTGVRTKRSWEHPVKWRSTNIITVKDVKWFLSIPAKYLYWSGGDPLISENPILMKALRKYEVLILEWQHYYEINLPYHYLNHSNHIKYLTIRGSWNFKAPILPSLIELELKNIMGEEDLTNLIYSLSLEEIILDHEEYIKTILIPNQVMERGVEIIQSNILDVVEVDATMCNKNDDDHDDDSYEEDESNDDDTIDIYDEDEVTEYSSEGDEEDEWNQSSYYSSIKQCESVWVVSQNAQISQSELQQMTIFSLQLSDYYYHIYDEIVTTMINLFYYYNQYQLTSSSSYRHQPWTQHQSFSFHFFIFIQYMLCLSSSFLHFVS